MKTMQINGFTLDYDDTLVGLDELVHNSVNPRTLDELEKNAKRIFASMFPEIDGTHRNQFRQDKFSMYVVKVKEGFKTLTANSSLSALRLWDDLDNKSFLAQFPKRMIPVKLFGDLKPMELLAVVSDHSTGYRSEPLSKEQTALHIRRIMAAKKSIKITELCQRTGYSPGKAKPYFALEVAKQNCMELFNVLWAGVVDETNLIRLSALPKIAALWTPAKDRTLPADRFGRDNKPLWKAVESQRDFGTWDNSEKPATEVEKLKSDIAKLDLIAEQSNAFLEAVASMECKSEIVRELLDAVIESDLKIVTVKVRAISKILAK